MSGGSFSWRHLPPWLTFNDETSLTGFYDGENTIYRMENLKGWLRPILWWTIFLTVLIWVMICLNIFLRRQWIERERLTYPIVQLPLEMTRLDGRLFRSRMMWLGFAIAGGINVINGFHVLFPEIPEIPVRHAELGQYFTQKPWKSIGWTPVYIRSFCRWSCFSDALGNVVFYLVLLLVLESTTGIGQRTWTRCYARFSPMIGNR